MGDVLGGQTQKQGTPFWVFLLFPRPLWAVPLLSSQECSGRGQDLDPRGPVGCSETQTSCRSSLSVPSTPHRPGPECGCLGEWNVNHPATTRRHFCFICLSQFLVEREEECGGCCPALRGTTLPGGRSGGGWPSPPSSLPGQRLGPPTTGASFA